jgi:L-seryl-tRNA(Ser) seleniumtransferase
VTTKIYIPEEGNSYPTLRVMWDETAFKFTVADCDQQLRAGTPRIEALTNSNPSMVHGAEEDDSNDPKRPRPENRLEFVSMTLQDGEDLIVGRRLREILNHARLTSKI